MEGEGPQEKEKAEIQHQESFDIRCRVCGGWHPTEEHYKHTEEGRKEQRAVVEKRSEGQYSFSMPGVEVLEEVKESSWRKTVVEKAKVLGDDLQDSSFLIHMGVLHDYNGADYKIKSLMSVFSQKSIYPEDLISEGYHTESKGSAWSFSNHFAGEPELFPYSSGEDFYGINELLVRQEEFVKERTKEKIETYQNAIKSSLEKIINQHQGYIEINLKYKDEIRRVAEFLKIRKEMLEKGKNLLNQLDSTNGRREAVKYVLTNTGWRSGFGEIDQIGIICKLPRNLDDKEYNMAKERDSVLGNYDMVDRSGVRIASVPDIDKELAPSRDRRERTVYIPRSSKDANAEDNLQLFKDFIHGVYLRTGSGHEQQAVLQRMLDLTKNDPERRVPIYNYYGKLVWPKSKD